MLIIANGAQKGGTTWLYGIVRSLPDIEMMPDKYRRPGHVAAAIDAPKAQEALDFVSRTGGNFCSKQHWDSDWRWFAEHEFVTMVSIVRDLPDVLVSRFHHERRVRGKTWPNADAFYRSWGKAMLERYVAFNLDWHRDLRAAQPYLIRFEDLRTDFDTTVAGLLHFLGYADRIAPEQLRFTDSTRPDAVGVNRNFRRSAIGDGQRELCDQVLRDIDGMAYASGYTEWLADRFPEPFPVSAGKRLPA